MSELSRRAFLVTSIGAAAAGLLPKEVFAEDNEPKDKDKNGKNNQNGSTRSTSPVNPAPAEQPTQPEQRRAAPVRSVDPVRSNGEVQVAALGQAPSYDGKTHNATGRPYSESYKLGQFEVVKDVLIGVAGGSVLKGRFPLNGLSDLALEDRGPVVPNALLAVASPVDTRRTAVIGVENNKLLIARSADEQNYTRSVHTEALQGLPESAKVSHDGRFAIIQTGSTYAVCNLETGRMINLAPDASGKPAVRLDTAPVVMPDGSYVFLGANPAANAYDKVTAYFEGTNRPRVKSETYPVNDITGTVKILNGYVDTENRPHVIAAGIHTGNSKPTDGLVDIDPAKAPQRVQINPNIHGRITGNEPLTISGATRDLTVGDGDWYAQVNSPRPRTNVEVAPSQFPTTFDKHYILPEGAPTPGLLFIMNDFDRGYNTRRLILVGPDGRPYFRGADTENPTITHEIDSRPSSWRRAFTVKY